MARPPPRQKTASSGSQWSIHRPERWVGVVGMAAVVSGAVVVAESLGVRFVVTAEA
jgi:hypothetical protein